jgi:hypothetical protein
LQPDLPAVAQWHVACDPLLVDLRPDASMPTKIEPSAPRVSNRSDATLRRSPDESRTWPRCEPAFTHFELGASSESRPTTVLAKRYTPRYGVRKE